MWVVVPSLSRRIRTSSGLPQNKKAALVRTAL